MMRRLPWVWLAMAVSFAGYGETEEFAPKRNPFKFAPAPEVALRQEKAPPKAKQVLPPRFVLRATLAAGDHSVANIDGRMVAIGESVDGFVLQSVTHAAATFTKEGKTFVVKLARP